MGITAELAAFTAALRLDRVPPQVVARARALVLDLVGSIVRARHDAESTPALLAAVRALGLGAGNNGVFGDAARYTPAGAALLNGALAHSLDFDDTHAGGSLHPGAAVIPAALAAGEMAGAAGTDVLAAIIAGYEVTCRIALALPAGAHYERGFHPSATCGAFGAAAAAARVFGLDAAHVESALGIALSQCAGSLQFLANGAWTKRFQVGWAASSGLAAATLAREGFKGAAEALEGRLGFFRAYAPNPCPERAVRDLGVAFELMETAVKPYPSCRYGHAGIDAALSLRAAHGLRPEEIERVTYGVSRAGMLLVGEPAARKRDPRNVVDGQFSGPFVLACALATGAMGWDSYRHLHDPVVRAEHGLRPEEIERVTYGVSRAGMLLVGEPAARKRDPQNVVDGQFSGPFVLACALATGAMGWDSYRLLRDPEVRGLMARITCAPDVEMEAEFPANMSGRVSVFARGECFVRTVIVPKGEPGNFLSEAELRTKFAGLTEAVLGVGRSAALADAVLRIDTTADISSLMRLASPLMAARLAGD